MLTVNREVPNRIRRGRLRHFQRHCLHNPVSLTSKIVKYSAAQAEQDALAHLKHHRSIITERWCTAMRAADVKRVAIISGELAHRPGDDVGLPHHANPWFCQFVPVSDARSAAIILDQEGQVQLVWLALSDHWHAPRHPTGDEPWMQDLTYVPIDNAARFESTIADCDLVVDATWAYAESSLKDQMNPMEAQLTFSRAIKTPYEIAATYAACVKAWDGHRAAVSIWEKGGSEFQAMCAFVEATGQEESSLPYWPIVATGTRCAILHADIRGRGKSDQRSFLIDAGASSLGYVSDITRTHADPHTPGGDVVEAVKRVHADVMEQVTAKGDFASLQLRALHCISQEAVNLGMWKGSAEDAYHAGFAGALMPHGLGHLLGLLTHDVGGHMAGPDGRSKAPPVEAPKLRTTRELKVGTMLTVEPGIYIVPALLKKFEDAEYRDQVNWDRVAEIAPYGGARHEDDVLVTEGAACNISRLAELGEKLPRTVLAS